MTIAYLIVLVPINWLVFWSIGKLEWAWIAAPMIAMGTMAAVVKMAQLDIGFARSQTEIGVLEMSSEYARGCLDRYTALYTSLSTTYDIHSDNASMVILPFATDPTAAPRVAVSRDTVTYSNEPKVRLSDFEVSSNSTGMLHSEEMLDLGGAVSYKAHVSANTARRDDALEISNGTKFPLEQAVAVRRTADGQYQTARIGSLPAGGIARVKFGDSSDTDQQRIPPTDSAGDSGRKLPSFDLEGLCELVRSERHLQPSETRLVAVIKSPLAGLQVEPASSQTPRGATLVVAELVEPPFSDPVPDVNSRRDVVNASDMSPDEAPQASPSTP